MSSLGVFCVFFFHGIPIRWCQATLFKAQLETNRTPDFCRELFEVVKTGTDELQRFHAKDYKMCDRDINKLR